MNTLNPWEVEAVASFTTRERYIQPAASARPSKPEAPPLSSRTIFAACLGAVAASIAFAPFAEPFFQAAWSGALAPPDALFRPLRFVAALLVLFGAPCSAVWLALGRNRSVGFVAAIATLPLFFFATVVPGAAAVALLLLAASLVECLLRRLPLDTWFVCGGAFLAAVSALCIGGSLFV